MRSRTVTAARTAAMLTSVTLICVQCAGAGDTGEPALNMAVTQNSNAIPLYDVFEITFTHDNKYANPWLDVTVDVTLRGPSRTNVNVGGFHYGSSEPPEIRVREVDSGGRKRQVVEYRFEKQDLWKARFAPAELGRWTYSYVFTNAARREVAGKGWFDCVKGRVHNPGFVRRNPDNPFRWVFDDGTPYFPIGLQEGWGDWFGVGTALAGKSMEGPFRTDRTNLVKLLPGPLYVRGPTTSPQNADVYARRHSRAGFNLYRFSQCNNTYRLDSDLDHYLVQEGIMTDEILQHLRKYGFRVFYGLFGYRKVFNDQPDNAEGMAKVKRFVKYSVDRWGAYVDFWQFLNEQKATEDWYKIMIPYLKSIDPYRHPVTTSWERPELAGIDINAPHDYYGSTPRPGAVTAQKAKAWKAHGKPVIVGEHGNHVNKDPAKRPAGHGGVWYPESAVRMRIRNWVAFFNEIAFIFWNTSYARDGHFMNIWLGPQERQYIKAMQDFAYRLDKDVRMAPVTLSLPNEVRAWGLVSERRAAVYLHHFKEHGNPVRGVTVTLDVPASARGYWYSPEDASMLGSFDAPAGEGTFAVPPFAIDLALLVTPDGPPDIDHDGKPNDIDPDDDGDGVADRDDAFPLESEEWEDKDGDLIGDNLDADTDGDGRGDDHSGNGTPDHEELDLDNDGVPRAKAVPWDAFPLDPKEWRDTDGDGIGGNADTDDDGDGWSDAEEKRAGTDPMDRLSFPAQ